MIVPLRVSVPLWWTGWARASTRVHGLTSGQVL